MGRSRCNTHDIGSRALKTKHADGPDHFPIGFQKLFGEPASGQPRPPVEEIRKAFRRTARHAVKAIF
eukprot:2214423-Amphidinium_carterae.1